MASFIRAITNKAVIVLLVISIVLLCAFGPKALSTMGDPVSFEDLLSGERLEEGDYVKGELLYSFGQYAAEDTVYESGAVKERNSTVYYVIPTDDEYVYYGLAVGNKLYKTIDKNSDETYAYLTGEGDVPVTCPELEGVVEVMEGELLDYWVEWLLENQYTQDEIDSMGTFYYIDYVSSSSVRTAALVGLVLLILAIIIIILIMSKDKRRMQMSSQSMMNTQSMIDTPQMNNNMFGNDTYAVNNAAPYANTNTNNNAYTNDNANTGTYVNDSVDTTTNNMDTNSTTNNEYEDPFAYVYQNNDYDNIKNDFNNM